MLENHPKDKYRQTAFGKVNQQRGQQRPFCWFGQRTSISDCSTTRKPTGFPGKEPRGLGLLRRSHGLPQTRLPCRAPGAPTHGRALAPRLAEPFFVFFEGAGSVQLGPWKLVLPSSFTDFLSGLARKSRNLLNKPLTWVWDKNRYPKWNPGKWKQ